MIIIIIAITAFSGAIWGFLQSPHCTTNRLQHVGSSSPGTIMYKLCATHQALITHIMLRAMRYAWSAQLLNLTDFKSHLFELSFIGWTIDRWRRGGDRSTRRKPLMTSFRKCHILKPNDSSPKQNSNPHNSIGDGLGKQTCELLHHLSPRERCHQGKSDGYCH